MNIGSVMFEFHGTTGTLSVDAKKEGEAAGAAAGASFNASMGAKLKTSSGALLGIGIGLELGKQILHGLENAISAGVNAIPSMIAQGSAFALTVDDISDKTGASAETASRFAGTLKYLGINADGLGMSLKTLSGDIVNTEGKFAKLGIQTRDSNGNLLDTITILSNVRGYLSGAADGATKMALAADLLGRSAGDLIDYLNLTDQQAAFLNTMMDNLAVTMGGDAVRGAESLRREQNLLGLAWQGLSNTLMTAVIPALRQFIGGIIEFVAKHGPELRTMLVDITNTVLGFATALVGIEGVTPFQMQLDALGGSTSKVSVSFEQWTQQMGYTIPKIDKATGSTKANTTAIDRQIKSTERAIDTEKRRSDTLVAAIDLQLSQLDLSERQIAVDQRKHDLNEQLNQAQLDLAKAQAPDLTTGKVDAGAVSDAMATIADIQAQQAENERQLGVDAQRDKLKAQRDEIEAKSKARTDELTALKTSLGEQRAAISASGSAGVSDNAKTLAALKAQYAAYLAGQEKDTATSMGSVGDIIAGNAAKGTGLGGAMTKAFADGETAGESFRAFLTDELTPAVKAFFQFFVDIKTKIDEIANSDVWKFLNEPVDLGKIPSPQNISDFLNGGSGVDPNDLNNRKNRASGGPVWAGERFIGNEKRQEFFAPANGTIIPSIGAARGLMADAGGTLLVEHLSLDLGGDRVLDWFDQRLSFKRRV